MAGENETVYATLKVYTDDAVSSVEKLDEVVNKTNQDMQGLQGTNKQSTSSFSELANGINVLTVALGIGLVQALSQVRQFFTDSITSADKFSASVIELDTAINQMQRSGQNITNSQFSQFLENLDKQFPFISKLQTAQGAGQATFLGAQLGLTPQDIENFLTAAAQINQSTGGVISFTDALQRLQIALTSTSPRVAIGGGVQFTQADVLAKANEMFGLQAKSLNALSDTERAEAAIAVIQEKLNGLQQDNTAILGTNVAAINAAGASWSNFQLSVGQAIQPVQAIFATLITGLDSIHRSIPTSPDDNPIVKYFKDILNTGVLGEIEKSLGTIIPIIISDFSVLTATVVADILQMQSGINDLLHGKAFGTTKFDWAENFTAALQTINDAIASKVNPNEWNQLGKDAGTALGDGVTKGIADTNPELTKVLTDMKKAIIEAELEQQQESEKYAVDLANKLQDIRNQYNFDLIKDKEKEALDERKIEEDLQLKLKELKQQFAYDEIDALRNRDASKILHLEAQYALEKTKAIEDSSLRMKQQRENYKLELEQLKQSEQDKEQQARLAYNRQLEALNQSIQDKLAREAAGYVAEYNLTGDALQALYKLIYSYYGPGGFINSIYSAIGLPGATPPYAPPSSGGGGAAGGGNRRASGGVDFATQSTSLVFGEAGPELAVTIPLNPAHVNPSTTVHGGSSSVGGGAVIKVQLSDGLEASIVQEAINGVAMVVEKIGRG